MTSICMCLQEFTKLWPFDIRQIVIKDDQLGLLLFGQFKTAFAVIGFKSSIPAMFNGRASQALVDLGIFNDQDLDVLFRGFRINNR